MALPPLIEKPKRDWLFKVTEEVSKQPERDLCLLGFFFATGLTTLQINRIQLADVLHKSGKLNKEFPIRGTDRLAYLSNKRLQELAQKYIEWRRKKRICLGNHPDQYCGLDPDEGLFISGQGKPFSIVRKTTGSGADSYSCDALNRHIKTLLRRAGIEDASILSGRRTFAVNLQRLGYDVAHIHYILGNKSLETTERLLTTDPIDIGRIAAQAF